MGGVMTKIIERNTTIPTKKSQVFSTAEDNQTTVGIRVYQGERSMAADNKMLGEFMLSDIPPSPRGLPQIEVSFDIDANGIMHVSASDKASGKTQNIIIKSSGGLTEDQIKKMMQEAEENAEKDKERKELIEVKNHADHTIHQAEKTVKEYGEKLPGNDRSDIENAINDLKNVKDKDDLSLIKSKMEHLEQCLMKVGQAMYGNQSNASDGDTSSSDTSSTSDSSTEGGPKDVG